MNFFEKFGVRPITVLKAAGIVLVGLFVISLVANLGGGSLNSLVRQAGVNLNNVAPSAAPPYSGYDYGTGEKYQSGGATGAGAPGLSARNVAGTTMPYPYPGGTTGDTAEQFEVTDYSATIETRHLQDTCGTITGLKAKTYVVFESANEYERGCSYAFKVAHDHVEEILAVVKGLDPRDLSESIYTIQQLVEDFTSQTDILQKKRTAIDETLASAVAAYDEVTALAIKTQNAESLAKVLDSRIGIIERLTQERISINAQLEQLARAKAQQLDRLQYTYFRVSITENKFVDGKMLADSWREAVRQFVRDLNTVLQDITINLVTLVFVILQYALYALILLFVAKYGWQIAKYIWRK